MNKYVVEQDGWLHGVLRQKGETVELTARQAKYLLLSGQIAEMTVKPAAVKPKPEKPAEKAADKPASS